MNIGIEKTVLSSFIFAGSNGTLKQAVAVKQYIGALTAADFLPPYCDIFIAIQALDAQERPIDEDFIKRELIRINKFNETALLDVLTTNPTANITPYIDAIREDSAKRALQATLNKSLQNGEIDIKSIQTAIDRTQNIGSSKVMQNVDLDELFDAYISPLTGEDFVDADLNFLLPGFIAEKEITMIAAKPSSGKSLVTLAASNMLLNQNKADHVIYIDLDNSIPTLKKRGLEHLQEKHGKRLQYAHPRKNTEQQIWSFIRKLQQIDLAGNVIVFDSAKNFMLSGDRDKNKDVSKLMAVLKRLRDNGATVVFLHHTNKPQKDMEELTYAGSSAFEEDVTTGFILKNNEYKNSYILTPFKNRTGEASTVAYKYNADNTLTPVDPLEASENEEIEAINNEIIDFIESQTQKPTYSLIMQHLLKLGFAKNKANQALQNGKNRYWNEEKLTQNNRSVYTLIKQPAVIEFQTITENSMDKSDKSDKSCFRSTLTESLLRTSEDKWQKDEARLVHSLKAPQKMAMPVI